MSSLQRISEFDHEKMGAEELGFVKETYSLIGQVNPNLFSEERKSIVNAAINSLKYSGSSEEKEETTDV